MRVGKKRKAFLSVIFKNRSIQSKTFLKKKVEKNQKLELWFEKISNIFAGHRRAEREKLNYCQFQGPTRVI